MTPTVGDLVLEYLRAQRAVIARGQTDLRDARPVVHEVRVGIRRLRSTLRTYAAVFLPGATETLDAELRWYANTLGEVRDREVQRERLAARLAGLPADLVRGPVAADIDAILAAEQAQYAELVLEVLDSARYESLLTRLDEFLADPPFTPDADRRAAAARDHVRRADNRFRRLLARGLATDNDEELHRARKAGKRARYAHELAGPVGDQHSDRRHAELTAAQEALGEFQDGVVAAHLLLRLTGWAEQHGRPTFTYGLLFERERALGQQARLRVAQVAMD